MSEVTQIGVEEFIRTVAARYLVPAPTIERVCRGEVWKRDGTLIEDPHPAYFNMGPDRYEISVDEIKKYFSVKEAISHPVVDEKSIEAFMDKDISAQPPNPVPVQVDPKKMKK